MCGICGAAALAPDAELPGPELLRRMTATLRHRGPDDEGFLFQPGVALGHRRLSVIDLAGGHQPIANEDSSRFIIFNGEIYNHREVRTLLEGRGHRYRTSSDTETILHLVEEEGIPGLNRLNGMWAFAVWDQPAGRLLLARDRLGVKPLYYAVLDSQLLFASEIKALLVHPRIPRELDPDALAAYLECQYVPGPRTIFRAIRKLPPGHALIADRGGVRMERYWNPDLRRDPVPTFAAATERLRELLEDSVRLRLLAEVPLGAFLSGGIDSSIVVGLMSRIADRPVKTFTVGFRGHGWYDESGEARAVARHFGAEHHELAVESLDLVATLESAVRALDEPMSDPAAIPTYLVSRFAREQVTVALTGEGADELFGGYDHFRFELALDRLGPAGRVAGRAAAAIPGPLLPKPLRRAVEAAALNEPDRHLRVRAAVDPETVSRLLRGTPDGFSRPTREALAEADIRHRWGDTVNRLLYLDAATWLPDDLLMKVDKMSMLASLEARVPFLDYRVVEFLFGLPGEYKISRGRSKRLLRAAFAPMLPPRTLRRRKHGFAVPIRRWLRHELREYVQDTLGSRDGGFDLLVERSEVDRLRRGLQRGWEDVSLPIWVLLNLRIWCREVLAGPPAGAAS